MKRFIRRFPGTLVICWSALIFLLCAFPGEFIPSNNWLDLLSVDKLIHAGIFFVLCFLFVGYATKHGKTNRIVLFVVLSVFYGISLEFMQGYCFRNRSLDWKDMVANSAGCLLAYAMVSRIGRFFREREA